MNIKHVVIPAAGHGTRFLPFTKSVCKEMVPLIDRPIIHHIIEEAYNAGIQEVSIITNEYKQALQHYFNHDKRLHTVLDQCKKTDLTASIDHLISALSIHFFNQQQQRGVADAIMQARSTVDAAFFGIMFPDDIIFSAQPALRQLIDIARTHTATVIAVTEVPDDKVSSYGIIKPKRWLSDTLCEVDRIIEKPTIAQAPSRWAIVGRFVVSPQIFSAIDHCAEHNPTEPLFTDALEYLATTERVYAYRLQGTRHDTGTPEGWLEAIVDYALRSPRYRDHVIRYLRACPEIQGLRSQACPPKF
jgi:UTP--glucose-1-phosphate uridylyltransferase